MAEQGLDPRVKILNAREFRFVENYASPKSPTCGKAFPSAKAAGFPLSTSQNEAHRWVRDPEKFSNPKPQIFYQIEKRREEIAIFTRMDTEAILDELSHIARYRSNRHSLVTSEGDPYIDLSNLTDEEWAAISETQVEEYTEGRGEDARDIKRIRVKTHDKIRALDLLGRGQGMFNNQLKIQHSNDPNNPMPGGGAQLDLTLLTEDELLTYRALVAKAMGK